MSLLRWDPFADMAHLRDQVNKVFEQSLTRSGREPVSTQFWAPAVDIEETDEALIFRAELPGMKVEQIDIQLTGDTLSIKGERKFEREEKGKQFVRIERAYGAFQRSFTLGLPVKQDGVRAAYREGILEITLPKAEEIKPKQVKVEIETPETIEVK
ncbi:MAG TPA: Hsp20/alpha crystallin family protein [Armatimonadota bacterium]|jgi:HSP20 family protein